MSLWRIFEVSSQRIADLLFMLLPRRRPTAAMLGRCKIVSHRGEHDNRRVRENTMPAFELVHQAGVWGIEFDVRWTADLHPVVIHDTDTRRVFKLDLKVAQQSFDSLRQQIPELPSLQEVVTRFGGKIHLMVELKSDQLGQTELKRQRLQQIFSSLKACEDYHFLALNFELFDLVDFAGDKACIPVAELNLNQISRRAMQRSFAGISGQYLLLHQSLIRRHRQQKQKIGTGFSASRFSFYRELNRGVDWIFTNHALKLRAIQQRLMRDS